MTKMTFEDVSSYSFQRLCELFSNEGEFRNVAMVYYTGSQLKGDITIDWTPVEISKRKDALRNIAEIIGEHN